MPVIILFAVLLVIAIAPPVTLRRIDGRDGRIDNRFNRSG